jgi:penicillin-binding protein 1A
MTDHRTAVCRRPAAPPPPWQRGLRLALLAAAAGLAGLATIGTAALGWAWQTTPDAGAVAQRALLRPSTIVSSDGVLLDTIGEAQPLTLDQVSPLLVQALLATEDRRFHAHRGIDPQRLLAAAWATLQGRTQGGSTLTQQLARNLFPDSVGRERSLLRKLREAVVALKIERAYSKPEILALYLNQVPFRGSVVGVGAAARSYFDKPAADLDAPEAALLVAMLKGPTLYDPLRRAPAARQRRDLVLGLLAEHAGWPGARLQAARATPMVVQPPGAAPPGIAPHYLREVQRALATWAAGRGLDPARDGLRITVSLDTRLQAAALAAVARQTAMLQTVADSEWAAAGLPSLPAAGPAARPRPGVAFAHDWRSRPDVLAELLRRTPAYAAARQAGADEAGALRQALGDPQLARLQHDSSRLEAGFIALDPRSGAVRAYVGSGDWLQDQFDHVSQARRQPGSTFKPFVYGAALAAGLSPDQLLVDSALTYTSADGQAWTPTDQGGASGQAMTLRTGLALSKNTITAQVMHEVGVHRVLQFARRAGIDRSPLVAVPSLALGSGPVTLLELASAYGTLAALGERRAPQLLAQVHDRHGLLLADFSPQAEQVFDARHTAQLLDMLREVVERGTGQGLRSRFGLHFDIAGKTGTSQRNADGWFMALQPGLVSGAWVGFNDQRVVLRSNRWGQGGHNALLLVGDFLAQARDAGLLATDQRFPAVNRPPPPPAPEPPALDPDEAAPTDAPADAPAGASADASAGEPAARAPRAAAVLLTAGPWPPHGAGVP